MTYTPVTLKTFLHSFCKEPQVSRGLDQEGVQHYANMVNDVAAAFEVNRLLQAGQLATSITGAQNIGGLDEVRAASTGNGKGQQQAPVMPRTSSNG